MPHSVLEKNDCSPEESFWYYPLAQPELPKMSPFWCQCSRYLRWAWPRTVRCFGGVLLSLWVTLSCPASLQSWFLGCSPLGSPLLSLLLRFPAPHFCLPKGAWVQVGADPGCSPGRRGVRWAARCPPWWLAFVSLFYPSGTWLLKIVQVWTGRCFICPLREDQN